MDMTLLVMLILFQRSDGDKELRLLGLQPMTGTIWPGGWACLVPLKMALDGINKHPDLLNGYKLTYEYLDDEVSANPVNFKRIGLILDSVRML